MSRSVRLASLAAALALGAPVAHAQFTPTVAIPRRRPVVAVDSGGGRRATSDTTPRVRLSDLKAWVDSVTQYAPQTLPAPGTAAPATPAAGRASAPTPSPRPAGAPPKGMPPAGAPPASPSPAARPATAPPTAPPTAPR